MVQKSSGLNVQALAYDVMCSLVGLDLTTVYFELQEMWDNPWGMTQTLSDVYSDNS